MNLLVKSNIVLAILLILYSRVTFGQGPNESGTSSSTTRKTMDPHPEICTLTDFTCSCNQLSRCFNGKTVNFDCAPGTSCKTYEGQSMCLPPGIGEEICEDQEKVVTEEDDCEEQEKVEEKERVEEQEDDCEEQEKVEDQEKVVTEEDDCEEQEKVVSKVDEQEKIVSKEDDCEDAY